MAATPIKQVRVRFGQFEIDLSEGKLFKRGVVVRLENRPTPGNPKTSLLAPLSALALLRQLSEPVRVGS